MELRFKLELRSLEPSAPPKNPPPLDKSLCFRYYLFRKEKLLDSSFQWIKSDPNHRKIIQCEFRNIKTRDNQLLLRTELYDFYNGRRYFNTYWLNFNSRQLGDKFKIIKLPDSSISTETFFNPGDSIAVLYRDKSYDKLGVQSSSILSKPAPPPWYIGDMPAKTPVASFYSMQGIKNGGIIHFSEKGNYFIRADTTLNEGLWLNCFGKEFPYAYMPEEFAGPLIYLCSRDEFSAILGAEDIKASSADFWKKSARSDKIAETMSNVYYQRVEQANINFSTLREGWKTDRGMIFLVFGQPGLIYTDTWGETWSYRERPGIHPGVSFRFSRKNTPGGEELTLYRDEAFRSVWNLATEAWRNGRILK